MINAHALGYFQRILIGPDISESPTFLAQFFGAGDMKNIRKTLGFMVLVCGIIAGLFFLVTFGFPRTVLRLFTDIPVMIDLGAKYMRIAAFSTLFLVLAIPSNTALRSIQKPHIPLVTGIISFATNTILNYVLIFGKFGAPRLGVVGAAAATVLARFVEMAIVVIWTHRHTERNPFIIDVYRSLKVPGHVFRQVLVLGLPLMINELLWSGGMTVLNQCYSVRGLEVVSAMNIYLTISNLFFSAFISTGNATAIMVGQLLGAGELERAVDEDRKLIAFAFAISFVLGGVMALCAPFFPRIYNTIPRVRQIATEVLIIGAAMMPLHAFANSCYFTLRSGGKTFITFLFDSGSVWLLSIPVAFILAYRTGVPIVPFFTVIEALNLVKCVIGTVMVRRRHWVVNLVADNNPAVVES